MELENPFGMDANDLDSHSMQMEINEYMMLLIRPSTERTPTVSSRAHSYHKAENWTHDGRLVHGQVTSFLDAWALLDGPNSLPAHRFNCATIRREEEHERRHSKTSMPSLPPDTPRGLRKSARHPLRRSLPPEPFARDASSNRKRWTFSSQTNLSLLRSAHEPRCGSGFAVKDAQRSAKFDCLLPCAPGRPSNGEATLLGTLDSPEKNSDPSVQSAPLPGSASVSLPHLPSVFGQPDCGSGSTPGSFPQVTETDCNRRADFNSQNSDSDVEPRSRTRSHSVPDASLTNRSQELTPKVQEAVPIATGDVTLTPSPALQAQLGKGQVVGAHDAHSSIEQQTRGAPIPPNGQHPLLLGPEHGAADRQEAIAEAPAKAAEVLEPPKMAGLPMCYIREMYQLSQDRA